MTNWYYHDPAQGRVGPIDADAIRGHFRAGRIGRDTLLWREGLREWQPLERLSAELELDQDLLSPPPLPAAPPPLPAAPDYRTDTSAPEHAQSHAQRSVSPADYAPAHVARRQPAAAPKRGLSGCMIALIVLAVVAIPVLGILAAIALPAYQDYTYRAKIAGAVASAGQYKTQVAEHVMQSQECPTNQSPGFRPAPDYASAQIASVEFGRFESGECGIQIELRGFNNPRVDGKKIWQSYDPNGSRWTCTSEIDKPAILPIDCRS
ncbi:pilin [Pseudomonas sp. CGJS7]|uniref:pilin n=1 Tax=Pseudomonas sp. CGJS7 TaxID=3109348 RepID=UPI0030083BDB